jgi:hypothetical protein
LLEPFGTKPSLTAWAPIGKNRKRQDAGVLLRGEETVVNTIEDDPDLRCDLVEMTDDGLSIRLPSAAATRSPSRRL